MAQLRMVFDAGTQVMPEINLAEGFIIQDLEESSLLRYNQLRQSVEFSPWTVEAFASFREKALSGGILLVTDQKTGEFVASACAEKSDFPEYPEIGVLGWVITQPRWRGKYLGRAVSVAAMHCLYRNGYRVFSLLTDDFRLAALKTYLRLGWRPWLYQADMPERWQKIAEKLNLTLDDFHAVEDINTLLSRS